MSLPRTEEGEVDWAAVVLIVTPDWGGLLSRSVSKEQLLAWRERTKAVREALEAEKKASTAREIMLKS